MRSRGRLRATRCARTREPCKRFAGKGAHGTFLAAISDFYLRYHRSFYGMEAVYLHDPCALVAAVRPELFTWHEGAVVVAETGALRGKTLLDGALLPCLLGGVVCCVRMGTAAPQTSRRRRVQCPARSGWATTRGCTGPRSRWR